jgi:hypothetical protein
MSNSRFFWTFACSLGLSCIECSSYGQSKPPQSNKPIETTVCRLVADCKRFDGYSVQFRASVSSDWFEHTALVDPECKRGIVPQTSEEADKRPDVAAFDQALAEGKPGTTDLSITATFTGRFVCNPASLSPANRRVIEIQQVSGLAVTKTTSGRLPRKDAAVRP